MHQRGCTLGVARVVKDTEQSAHAFMVEELRNIAVRLDVSPAV